MNREVKVGLIVGLIGLVLFLPFYFFLNYLVFLVLFPVAIVGGIGGLVGRFISYNSFLLAFVGGLLVFGGYFLYGFFIKRTYDRFVPAGDKKKKGIFIILAIVVIILLIVVQFFLNFVLYNYIPSPAGTGLVSG